MRAGATLYPLQHGAILIGAQENVLAQQRAAVQGAAVGGGLGLAMMPDFRVAAPEARFTANFARLGFHQGFGLSETLPRAIGQQKALELFYTGRRVKGEEAVAIGLADQLAAEPLSRPLPPDRFDLADINLDEITFE